MTTACVGRCDFGYRMDCPQGQRVAPRDLVYHAKATSPQCPANSANPEVMCQSSEQCCKYYGGDCSLPFPYRKAFEVFNNCSGYQQCGWFRAESEELGSRCSLRDTTNYVSASFSCIKGKVFSSIQYLTSLLFVPQPFMSVTVFMSYWYFSFSSGFFFYLRCFYQYLRVHCRLAFEDFWSYT